MSDKHLDTGSIAVPAMSENPLAASPPTCSTPPVVSDMLPIVSYTAHSHSASLSAQVVPPLTFILPVVTAHITPSTLAISPSLET